MRGWTAGALVTLVVVIVGLGLGARAVWIGPVFALVAIGTRMSTPSDVNQSRLLAWGKLLLGIGAAAFAVSFGLRSSEWWEFTSVVILALLAVVLIVSGVKNLRRKKSISSASNEDAAHEDLD